MLFTARMKKNKEFLYLFKKGNVIVGKTCIVYYKKNNTPYNKIGISSSKKIGNAVNRNRARRVIRAAYYNCEQDFPIGFNIIVVARKLATVVKSDSIEKFFKSKVINEMNKINKK